MLILPANIESYRSLKDRSVKIVFETAELNPSQVGDLQGNLMKAGFLAFKPDPFKKEEIAWVDSIEADFDDPKKTPSKRLRAVLYLNFQQDPEGYQTFPSYYESKMETIINHMKKKLD